MTARAVVACLVGAATLALGGCGSGSAGIPGPLEATGRYAGEDDGVGVSLDFIGFDTTSRQIEAALPDEPGGWTVGIASIVNTTRELKPVPALFVTRPNGRVGRLTPARRLRRGEAVEDIPLPGNLPVEGALTVYFVVRGPVADIRRVEMRVGSEPLVELTAQPRREGTGAGG